MATVVKYAIRTATGWASMTAGEQAAYAGYFDTFTAWEAIIPADITLATGTDEQWIADLYDDWINGYPLIIREDFARISDSTNSIVVQAATGLEYDYRLPTVGARIECSNGNGYNFVVVDGTYISFSNIGFTNTISSGKVVYTSGNIHLYKCVGVNIGIGDNVNHTLESCLIYCTDFDSYFTRYSIVRDTVFISKGTSGAYSGQMPVRQADLYNSICYNETVGGYDSFYACTGDYNASNDASAPGINSITTLLTTDFLDYINDNYNLSTTSQLIRAGKNLVQDGTLLSPQVDIDGDPLPDTGSWDIGFDFLSVADGRPFKEVKYAIRTAAGWAGMTAPEQDVYEGSFELLSTWESIIPRDLIVINEKWVAECYYDWPAGLADSIDTSLVSGSVVNSVLVTSPLGERHNGIAGNGFYIDWQNQWTTCFLCSRYTYLSYLDIRAGVPGGSGIAVSSGEIDNCILQGNSSGSVNTRYLVNSIIHGNTSSTNGAVNAYQWGDSVITNNVFHDNTLALSEVGSTSKCLSVNNTFYGNVEDMRGVFKVGSSNSATSRNIADHISISLLDILASSFIDAPNGDYHLSTTSQLIRAGKNLVQDGTLLSPQVDIDGDTLPDTGSVDIGFDFLSVAAGRPFKEIKYAIRTATAWGLMTQTEQDVYEGSFELLSTWESIIPTNLVVLNEKWIAEGYEDDFDATGLNLGNMLDSTVLVNAVSSATNNVEMRAALNNYFAWDLVQWQGGFDLGRYASLKDMSLLSAVSVVKNSNILRLRGGNFVYNTKIINRHADYRPNGISLPEYNNTQAKVYNCLLVLLASGVNSGYQSTVTNLVYNTVIVDSGTGLLNSGKKMVSYNNVTINCTTDSDVLDVISSNNATSKAVAEDASFSTLNVTDLDFIDAPNGNYHLSATSQLRGAGLNLIENGTLPNPQYDIDGDQLPITGAWDAGFDYYVVVGGIVVSVGLISEISLGLNAEATSILTPVNIIPESDLVNSITKSKVIKASMLTETNLASILTKLKLLGISTITEANSAIIGSILKTVILDGTSELNISDVIGTPSNIPINISTELDSANPTGKAKALSVSITSELNTSNTIYKTKGIYLSLVSELDTVIASTTKKLKAIGKVTESNYSLALSILNSTAVYTALESSLAFIHGVVKQTNVNISTELDSANPTGKAKALSVSGTLENSASFGIVNVKKITINRTAESNQSIATLVPKYIEANSVYEVDASTTVGKLKEITVGTISELTTALDSNCLKVLLVDTVYSNDDAINIIVPKSIIVNNVSSTEQSFAILIGGAIYFVPIIKFNAYIKQRNTNTSYISTKKSIGVNI